MLKRLFIGMKSTFFVITILGLSITLYAQVLKPDTIDSTDYYYQIPDYPETYTATSVTARTIDGLGFRYYWATEGLRQEDLDFKPSEEARTLNETLNHIYDLTLIVYNAISGITNENHQSAEKWSYMEKRNNTLVNIQRASETLKSRDDIDMNELNAIFKRGDKTTEYPFWNMLNGPIEDAVWHVGQVVTFRRSSGNPLNAKASMFNGKVKN